MKPAEVSERRWTKLVDLATSGPDITQQTSRIHFDLPEGMIWFDSTRVTLVHAQWLSELRADLIAMLGYHQTRGQFTRLGYSSGCRDAQSFLARNPGQSWEEMVLSGGQIHMLQGSMSAMPVVIDLDESKRRCHIEFLWRNSVERVSEQERQFHGAASACWMQTGHVSGSLTTLFGSPVLAREVECCSSGHNHCRVIARFVDQCEDAEQDLAYYSPLNVPIEANPTLVSGVTAPIPAPDAAHLPSEDRNGHVIGRSPAFAAVLHRIHQVADTQATVLLLGESGVGKSMLAAEIHARSPRRQKPFVEINCAAIPESLLEAELFGVEKGAYTGAGSARPGRFEEAAGGSIFLDEISTLSISAQAKLLRVLQSGKFERLGSNHTMQANARLIAATNEDLRQAVEERRFRADLFYRLHVFPLDVPPLRNRKDDLPGLINHFLRLFSERHGRRVNGISSRAYQTLMKHDWPGNIRELENLIERAVILTHRDEALDLEHFVGILDAFANPMLQLDSAGNLSREEDRNGTHTNMSDLLSANEGLTLAEIEKQAILTAFRQADGNAAKTARRLGITRSQIDYRLKRWRAEGII